MGTAIKFAGARLTYGSILMILLAMLIWYVLNRTASAATSTPPATTRTRRAWRASTPAAP